MKTYRIENTYIGYLNNGETYNSFIEAMTELMMWVKEDSLTECSIANEYPKSKWAICQEVGENESKTIFIASTKKILS